ncbi:hypothetical protein EST38_g2593 [Candolleomyces aberdarensis]|uniref:RING-type domain-containing protein n=1 Tax=Candolleomyces aberdarensis TaxID=2316362 RepID=A0A4Q2DV66_9AGAR|nr:hypothetical protein EST38_g2593 [Candolleomyces aberdarensis]
MSGLPACAVCYYELHPVTLPAERIICGHCFCLPCIDRLIKKWRPCPMNCRNRTPLRRRDVRSLPISIAPTTTDDDDAAVLQVTTVVLRQRDELRALDITNTQRLNTLSKRVSTQISTLLRFNGLLHTATLKHSGTATTLEQINEELRNALEIEQLLSSELAATQRKLRAIQRELEAPELMLLADVCATAQKRPVEDISSDVQERADANPRPLQRSRTVPSPIATRLELQDIRYQLLAMDIARPLHLDFVHDPLTVSYKVERFAFAYQYSGCMNAAPFHLTHSPANALFLDMELQLHEWAERLQETKSISSEHNFELQRKSVEKSVKGALNQLFNWKREMWWRKRLESQDSGYPAGTATTVPCVETTRYLQLYNYGDPVYAPFVTSGFLLVLVVHLLFHGSQMLCEVILAWLHDQVVILGSFIGPQRQQQLKKSIPSTVRPVLNSVDLDPYVRRFVQCPKCYALYPTAVPYPDTCSHRAAPNSSPCGTKLIRHRVVKGKMVRKPIKYYVHQGDGFNPFFNRESKQTVTSTGLYLFCLNLPLEERQKPQNIYLAGVIPGPDKPSTTQINHFTSLVVDDFLVFWETGVRYTRTSKRANGVRSRASLIPVLCDALGARQLGGVENFDRASWPERTADAHRYWAELWRISDEPTRLALFKAHGIRYTPLLRLPYFDPVKHIVVDTMHNFYLGLLQRHCRYIWGMDLDIDDGDGLSRPGGNMPKQPSQARMAEGRRQLEFNDISSLAKQRRDVLYHLCLEFDLRRGGKKKDYLRELIQWVRPAFLVQLYISEF